MLTATQERESGRRLLRLGIVQNGRMIEERLLRRRHDVTIGQSTSNTLAIPSDALPRRWSLFELHGGRYVARLTGAMDARIAVGQKIVSLAELKRAGKTRPNGTWRVPLDDGARGKVIAGDVTVLFQLVRPPAPRPRPQLPASVRRSILGGLEPFFTAAMVLSLVFHLGLVLHLRTVDWPRHPDPELVPDRFAQWAARRPLPLKVALPTPSPVKPTVAAPRIHASATPSGPRTPAPVKPTMTAEERAASDAARRKLLVEKVSKMGIVGLIGARTADGGALTDLLQKGNPDVDQEAAMKDVRAVQVAGTNDRLVGIRPGGGGGKVTTIESIRAHGAITDGGPGGPVTERAAPGEVVIKSPVIEDGVADANLIAKEVRGRMGGIRACYERALKRNPSLTGKIVLRWTITPAGTVSGIEIDEDTLGDPELVACLKAIVARWRFPSPEGGSVQVSFPFVFQAAG